MTPPLFFSRATLKGDPAIEALAPLLMPADGSAKLQADHRLVWSLFAGDRAAKRDFLFRRKNPGANANRAQFLILSKRPPLTDSALFDVETKHFAPALAAGDRLGFSLYANPAVTHWRIIDGRKVRHRDDVVMHALKDVPEGERAGPRVDAIKTAGRAWLERQGERAGFEIADAKETLKIDGYDQFEIDRDEKNRHQNRRDRKKDVISISVLTFDGIITVKDPEIFLRELPEGFGRARAFGCGLMLLRRV
jgi:CRISPR system Cascade subunit CasE